MKPDELEDIIILETPYYKKLQKIYRETLNFKRYHDVLKKITRGDGFVKALDNRETKELVYFGRRILSLQEEFVTTYLQYLNDESRMNQWENFFERYSKNLFEIYEKFVNGDSNRILIFEIVNRKLLRDLFTVRIQEVSFRKKISIAERYSIVIDQLFNYSRNSLAKKMPVVDNLIVESYERIPLFPRCRLIELLKLLSKKLLEKGLPEPLFTAIFKATATSHYLETKEKIIKALNEKPVLNKDAISEIFSTHFFFPDEASLAEILTCIQARAREMVERIKEKRAAIEHNIFGIRTKIGASSKNISGDLLSLAENFSTEESIDNIIQRLRRNIITNAYDLKFLKSDYQKHFEMQIELNSILGFKPTDLEKFIIKNEWDPLIILCLSKNVYLSEEKMQLLIKDTIGEIRNDETAMNAMNAYRMGSFLKEKFDTEEINRRFRIAVTEIIAPLIKSLLLEELIEYYPKLSGMTTAEGVRYVAEEAIAGRVSVIEKSVKTVTPPVSELSLNISNYKNLISVLIYDIRGSTFMGTKLKDARKESEIRNLFQESMLAIVEKNGGIPIKDTGDGGIALFTANYYDIKNKQTLEPQAGSTLPAVRSSLEMINEARRFVELNINKYKDWFRETEERTIDFEGVTYATLPPAYKSIFQIGIGIASGAYPKELYVERNAFGELDLAGMLVREANFYSKIKGQGESKIVCDDATVYNLLLNIDKFSFLSEGGLRIDPLLLDTEQGLEYWINQRVARRGFILDLYKIFVARLGEEIDLIDNVKIALGDHDIVIDEAGEIKDGKGGRGKFLFEIFSEEKG